MRLPRRLLAISVTSAALPLAARALSTPSSAAPRETPRHRVVIQISEDDPKTMNLALNNGQNLSEYFHSRGEQVQIEFVAYGPGLTMVRSDISPVKQRLEQISATMKNVTFSGCGNTLNKTSRVEGKQIGLLPQATLVPSGITRIVELQENGWSYVRP